MGKNQRAQAVLRLFTGSVKELSRMMLSFCSSLPTLQAHPRADFIILILPWTAWTHPRVLLPGLCRTTREQDTLFSVKEALTVIILFSINQSKVPCLWRRLI